jgi:CBS domain-containing protein
MQVLEKLTVGSTNHPDLSPLLLIRPDEDFATVVQRLARQPELRGTFVVDDEQRLIGVITRGDLLDWARAQLGTSLQAPFQGTEKTLRLASLINASTVGQVLHKNSNQAAVTKDSSLAHALRLMVELDLTVLPVVDSYTKVIGEVKLSDILARAIEASYDS